MRSRPSLRTRSGYRFTGEPPDGRPPASIHQACGQQRATMHIPDGFLDTKTAVAAGAFSATGVGYALNRVRLESHQVPLMGVAAAFVFAAQMLNFPVAGGTSGHLVGAVLASVLLGPSAAIIVLTAVIVVQSLLFADGGILALGANVLNMGLVGCLSGYGIYRAVRFVVRGESGRFLAIGFASWCSTVLASLMCSAELSWSGVVSWNHIVPVMTNIHMVIGVGEGVITMLIVAAIWRVRPELLDAQEGIRARLGYTETIVYGLLIALSLILFVLPFASKLPDGLQRVASRLGFDTRVAATGSPLAGYQIPGIGSLTAATALAGAVGALVVFGLSFILARVIVRKSRPSSTRPSATPDPHATRLS